MISPVLLKEEKFNDIIHHLKNQISTIETNINKLKNDEEFKKVIE